MQFGHVIMLQIHEFMTDCKPNSTLAVNSMVHLLMHSLNYTHNTWNRLLISNLKDIQWMKNGSALDSFYNVPPPSTCIIEENKEVEATQNKIFIGITIAGLILTVLCGCCDTSDRIVYPAFRCLNHHEFDTSCSNDSIEHGSWIRDT